MNSPGYISIDDEKLHYIRIGTGKRLLIAFHGYGNDASLFAAFEKYIENDFTLISIDLPYHGKSEWHDGKLLTKEFLIQLVNTLKQEAGVNKVSLLGYSIGGRICLFIMEHLPGAVDKALLIAPDGLAFNRLYFFVTKTFIGQRLFRNMLAKPKSYFTVIELLKKTKLLDENLYRFVMYYLGTEISRNFLLKVWPCFKDIIPDTAKLKAVIKQYGIPVYIFMGLHDKAIPPALAEKFKRGLAGVHLHVLNKGHKVLDDDTAAQMAECLL